MAKMNAEIESFEHLKQVSKIKHTILEKYLPAWEIILGSQRFFGKFNYVDCYAGAGFHEYNKKKVEGSPIIAVRTAIDYLKKHPNKKMTITLIEKDKNQFASLEKALKSVQPYPPNLTVDPKAGDSTVIVPNLLEADKGSEPTFFLVDPYGHPLTIPILNDMLSRKHNEALINFMFYMINRDVDNPKVVERLNKMFGNEEWQKQEFRRYGGPEREEGLLEYFKNCIIARYKLHFRVRFDLEDNVRNRGTKYYLIHASNHVRAALLMKAVMWRLGDQEGIFDYSGSAQGILFSSSPTEEELRNYLLKNFAGRELTFDGIREETWNIPFIEKHYRAVIQQLEKEDLAKIKRVSSKESGLKRKDLVYILPYKYENP